ncbi:acyl-CoA dehydrogenase [Blastococcus sp. MG754426]|uniref:acyl-CoA dehydrogenase family protein n=1 Tax=unclassified Blastococcus TaxID=2619396 RepID=UPI001EF13680|nr:MULTISPECIES: acyl-CoA dehydrogenase family protein [unclassified Blastococcus]MCF6509035.1 acyl-CoA dehydrogenase [Blastococcus sp. MG754426]MCF6512196.1 acyl-CoA dehydrogenase [Blastococcus sp. MG754427]MCF6736330.1 acyl-CoA dehydrogenase [Blastococcus sp. KM273129]
MSDPSTITSDFYDLEALLDEDDRALLHRVRTFMDEQVTPIINEYWTRAEFPRQLIPAMAGLGIAGVSLQGYGCPGRSSLVDGMIAMELSKGDPSISTFMGVHGGLAMGSIHLCGSEEQKERWLPAMARMELIGAFGLTEPEHGSDVARGLRTTARRDGDSWVLDGEKKWIGNASFADLVIIWARDVETDRVLGFVVEQGTPGFTTVDLKDKIALRAVQNAHITLEGVRVPEANRLQEAHSFRATADVLRMTRAGVAWSAVGCSRGAYEHALRYALEREQFGQPIVEFQLVQDLLVRMLGNITASAAMCARLSQLQMAGTMTDEHASLAKAFCTMRMRETVGWARELMGGNGILLENHVGRFVADAEAIYSYEGTREVNTLIVGRGVTGASAIV